MSHKLKVMTVVGTRPEIIRLSEVIKKLDKYFDHCLIHTGQNYDYELNEIVFDDLEIRKPDVFLEVAGKTSVETIGRILISIEEYIERNLPDAFLVLGDTNSALSALVAKRKKVPVFHMEAGNRCFDFRVPEEINRRIVDHIADINLTYSDIAREYLLNEGIPADQIIKTGSPMREVLQKNAGKIDASCVVEDLGLKRKGYFLCSLHREENVDSPAFLSSFTALMNMLTSCYKIPVLVSTHPRTRKSLERIVFDSLPHVIFHKPFGFSDYIKLQKEAKTVLSDSGTITEESSILNFPALNLRDAHERPEGFEEGAVMLTGLSFERVKQGLSILEQQLRHETRTLSLVKDYGAENVSDKVVRIIVSYVDYINRKIWKKSSS
jgi:UDP-N-acetylglucosamine 2-epimerase